MSTWKISGFLILVLAVSLFAQQPAGIVVIQGPTVITGTGRAAIRNAAIVIENGKIRDIGARADVKVPGGAQVIDARNKWVIPGLIDAHVHISQSGGLYTRPDIIDLRKWRPYDKEVEWIKGRLAFTFEHYIMSGITSVVDCGGPMWNFEMRDIASRTQKAPRVAVAGPLIATWAPPETDTKDPDVIEAKSPDHARELVRQQLEHKPDLIKIWFVRTPNDDFQKEIQIVAAAIAEAKSHNVRVAVHATELDTAKAAVMAGADILVHSVSDRLIDTAFLDMVRSRDVLYMTTFVVEDGYRNVLTQHVTLSDIEQKLGDPEVIATWADLAKIPPNEIPGGAPSWPPAPRRPVAYDNLMLMESAGVRIVGATDAGNIGTLHGPALHRELELMADAGMRPSDIIVSATKNAAAVMGRQNELGTLEKGKLADLVILDADPVIDIKNTRKISRVMKGGEFVF
jgi:imidazolonepropionase-like amidohydrolase